MKTVQKTMKTENNSDQNAGLMNPRKQKSVFTYGGTVETACMVIIVTGLIASLFTRNLLIRTSITAICLAAFIIPAIAKAIRKHNSIDVMKILEILKKQGFMPMVKGDGIHWVTDGKECILRIHGLCQVEIAREYDIPSEKPVLDGNEKAAVETMKEVYLAKVSVWNGDETSRLSFSTESLCSTVKEFTTYLPMCLKILDLAESRQRTHIKEQRECGIQSERRRIGFEYTDIKSGK